MGWKWNKCEIGLLVLIFISSIVSVEEKNEQSKPYCPHSSFLLISLPNFIFPSDNKYIILIPISLHWKYHTKL